MTIYDFKVTDNTGNTVSLDTYRAKVLLVVNTATQCGLTPQYKALEALYQKYREQGLIVLDFPSNQFLGQAPGTDEEIGDFCTLHYHTTFPRFKKVEVNGKDAEPLYTWLRQQAPQDRGDEESLRFENKVKLLKPFAHEGDIKWNFGKFLIDRQGNVHARYAPAYKPDQLEGDIEALL